MDPRALAAAIAEDRAGGLHAVRGDGHRRQHVHHEHRSRARRSPTSARASACGCTWTRAYAGSAAVVPELRWVLRGCERADSLVMNPHKWLFVPVDTLGLLHAASRGRAGRLQPGARVSPRTTEESVAPNMMDYGVSLGRRFRALKLWMVIRAFGHEGLAARIREHVRLAQVFRGWVEQDPAFEVVAPSLLSQWCASAGGARGSPRRTPTGPTRRSSDAVNLPARPTSSHTKLGGRTVIRLAIGNVRTEERHVQKAWDQIRNAVGQVNR